MTREDHATCYLGSDTCQKIGFTAIVVLHSPVFHIELVEIGFNKADQLEVGVARYGGKAHEAFKHFAGGHGGLREEFCHSLTCAPETHRAGICRPDVL